MSAPAEPGQTNSMLAKRSLLSPWRSFACIASKDSSTALEVSFDLPSRQAQQHRAAVGADGGIRRAPELGKQELHLLQRQRIVRLDGGVTGHGRGDAAQGFFDASAAIEPLQILGEHPD